MKIEKIRLMDIKPYWRNPRKNVEGIKQIQESIKKFGYQAKIIVDENYTIIVGHSRFKALIQLTKQLGPELKSIKEHMKTADEKEKMRLDNLYKNLEQINKGMIDIQIADDLNDRQVKEYRITDNKTGEFAEWDLEKLGYEIKELGGIIGFEGKEIEGILKDPHYKFEDYTKEQLAKGKSNLIQSFSNREEDRLKRYLDIMCPHCHEEFQIDKSELEYSGPMKPNVNKADLPDY